MTTERNREGRVPEEPRRGSGRAGTGPRTLAEELRTRPDEELAALLRARPDLLNPVPNDLTQLATRAGTRASVVRALERLDRFALQTAEALAVAPDPCPPGTLLALMTGDDGDDAVAEALPRAVATLRTQALVWGGPDRLHLVRTARELLSPTGGTGARAVSPTGLGPTVAEACAGMSPGRLQDVLVAAGLPATHDPVTAVESLTALFSDRERMADLIAQAPPEAQALLARLTWGPPYGTVPATPAPPVRWLTARGLLLPAGTGTVVLPREAALHLRGGRAHRHCEPLPPGVVTAAEHRPKIVDSTAAGQAHTALTVVEELLTQWDTGGPAVLRAGGLSSRDLKRTASALDLPEATAAFWIELAYAAGLLASDGAADERFAPTPASDEWRQQPAEERWTVLADAWLTATRTPGVAGGQDPKGRVLSTLGPGLDRSPAPEVRARVLELLASLPEGAAAGPESLLARLRWEHGLPQQAPAGPDEAPEHRDPGRTGRAPYRPGGSEQPTADLRSRLARWTLTECELLGVTGRGALSSHGRALTERAARGGSHPEQPHPDGPARLLAPLLPQPVDHILIQADLTAVAPGPLERPLAEAMATLADVESKGAATVYRFTPGSVRRALDSGRTAADLHAFLASRSRTPVPQPLSYLIDDVARRHGHLRVGAASAYVRCDDDALLAEIVADRRSEDLRLRRLAPTVLAAAAAPDVLLARLREMGYAPAAEGDAGDVLVTRASAHRTPPRTPPAPVPDGPPVPGSALLGAAVKAVRAGDLATTAVRVPVPAEGDEGAGAPPAPAEGARLPRSTSAETLATVQAAALTGGAVCIGYVNADGAASQRVIAPVRVEGGFVTAYDHTSDAVRTYPLHRITGVAELADGAAP